MLYTDGMNIFMHHCMLLAYPGMLPHWMTAYIYVLCIYHMCMQILAHYGSLYVTIYEISISYNWNILKSLILSILTNVCNNQDPLVYDVIYRTT